MSRRPHTADFRRLLLRFNDLLRARLPGSSLKFLDGKPLLVGGYSKDRQARRGKAPGGWARGYRLHAIISACGAVEAFCVTPLDAGEPTVARDVLVWCGASDLRGALLLADAGYDSNELYEAVARAGGRLLAPRKKPGTGIGHHGQHPDRLAAIEALEGPARAAGRRTYRLREGVEQALGLLGNFPGGLPTGLPNHVRRLKRVRLWVMLKVILYHAHLLQQDDRRRRAG
jgi:IS5 family transposase